MRQQVRLINKSDGQYVKSQWLFVREAQNPRQPGRIEFEAEYKGRWYYAGSDFDQMCAIVPVKASRKVSRPAKATAKPLVVRRKSPANPKPAIDCGVTYEQWRAAKLAGMGYYSGDIDERIDPVKAPRGKGKEWADRFYCERRIDEAESLAAWLQIVARSTATHKQRVRASSALIRREAVLEGVSIARAIVAGEGDWAYRREGVRQAMQYATFLYSGAM